LKPHIKNTKINQIYNITKNLLQEDINYIAPEILEEYFLQLKILF
jgi:hypothetical protein